MKIETTDEVKELIKNMFLNEYCPHTKDDVAPKKKV